MYNSMIKSLGLSALLLIASNVFAGETVCEDLQLNDGSNKISVGIKRYDGVLTVGDKGMITSMSPASNYRREFHAKTLEVTAMTLQYRSSALNTYEVEMTFPYDSDLADRFNNGKNTFSTICEVSP